LQEEVQHATNGGAIQQQKRKEIVVVEGRGGCGPILAGLEQRTTSKMTTIMASTLLLSGIQHQLA